MQQWNRRKIQQEGGPLNTEKKFAALEEGRTEEQKSQEQTGEKDTTKQWVEEGIGSQKNDKMQSNSKVKEREASENQSRRAAHDQKSPARDSQNEGESVSGESDN